MGIRFRKRVKILPGVTINFSKSGASTTIGGKGGSVNIGKDGVYGNAGIPGTGIYAREKLSGDKANSRKSRKQQYKETHPQQGLFDVSTEQIEETSTKGALFGCLSIIACFAGGIFIGVKYDNIVLAIIIAILPFIYILISKAK